MTLESAAVGDGDAIATLTVTVTVKVDEAKTRQWHDRRKGPLSICEPPRPALSRPATNLGDCIESEVLYSVLWFKSTCGSTGAKVLAHGQAAAVAYGVPFILPWVGCGAVSPPQLDIVGEGASTEHDADLYGRFRLLCWTVDADGKHVFSLSAFKWQDLEHGASIRHLPSRSPHACQCGLSSRVEPSLTDIANVSAVLDNSLLDGTVPCSHRSSSRPSRSVSDSLRCDSPGALQAFACVTSTLHGPQSTANGHADAQMAAAAAAAPLLLLPPSDTPHSLQATASSKQCGRSSEYRQRRLSSLVQASARGLAGWLFIYRRSILETSSAAIANSSRQHTNIKLNTVMLQATPSSTKTCHTDLQTRAAVGNDSPGRLQPPTTLQHQRLAKQNVLY
ncbi:hypothetical protein CCHR01_07896 [Colletotrichum chrysophilum]|uniref:Uncharacterized protein n=1 Tax=Colletotrichum chrysophilum TaxID=1836956 RepID=A0AAD9EM13_9PEZI|nr:hypothetical protein CCHR01_07896 [Colletotrichum chrysophilum]